MKKYSTTEYVVVGGAVVLIGAATFFGGMKFQQRKGFQAMQGGPGQFGQNRMRAGQGQMGGNGRGEMGAGFRPVAGEILSVDETSVTVKLPDGSSKIILLSEKTTIRKASDASKTDLKVGEQVSVFGSQNPDGSVAAQNIQIGQAGMMRIQGEGASPSASGSPTASTTPTKK